MPKSIPSDSFTIGEWVAVLGPSPNPIDLRQMHPADTLPPEESDPNTPILFEFTPSRDLESLIGVPLYCEAVNQPFVLCTLLNSFNLKERLRLVIIDIRRICLAPVSKEYAHTFYGALGETLVKRHALLKGIMDPLPNPEQLHFMKVPLIQLPASLDRPITT